MIPPDKAITEQPRIHEWLRQSIGAYWCKHCGRWTTSKDGRENETCEDIEPEAVREQIEGEIDAVLNACNTKSFERVKSEVLDVLTSMVKAAAQQERARIRTHLGLTYTDREVDALIGPEDK